MPATTKPMRPVQPHTPLTADRTRRNWHRWCSTGISMVSASNMQCTSARKLDIGIQPIDNRKRGEYRRGLAVGRCRGAPQTMCSSRTAIRSRAVERLMCFYTGASSLSVSLVSPCAARGRWPGSSTKSIQRGLSKFRRPRTMAPRGFHVMR